jgi:hypothetical protein
MKKRDLYLNVTAAVLFSLMMVSATIHGNYGAKFLLIWLSFGVVLVLFVYKASKAHLKQSKKEKIVQRNESSLLIKFVKISAASYAMAFGLSFLAFLVLLVPIGFEVIDEYMENHFGVHMAVSTLICFPIVFKYLER